jgi:hypothetical protein
MYERAQSDNRVDKVWVPNHNMSFSRLLPAWYEGEYEQGESAMASYISVFILIAFTSGTLRNLDTVTNDRRSR